MAGGAVVVAGTAGAVELGSGTVGGGVTVAVLVVVAVPVVVAVLVVVVLVAVGEVVEVVVLSEVLGVVTGALGRLDVVRLTTGVVVPSGS